MTTERCPRCRREGCPTRQPAGSFVALNAAAIDCDRAISAALDRLDALRALVPVAEEVIRLDGEATPGPWSADPGTIEDTIGVTVACDAGEPTEGPGFVADLLAHRHDDEGTRAMADATLIARTRTLAPDLARAIVAAVGPEVAPTGEGR